MSQKVDFTTFKSDYTITNLPAHSGGANNYTLTKVGNIVILNIAQLWSDTPPSVSAWTTLGNLPSSLAPSKDQRAIVEINDAGGVFKSLAILKAATSGELGVFVFQSGATGLTNVGGGMLVWAI